LRLQIPPNQRPQSAAWTGPVIFEGTSEIQRIVISRALAR